MEDLFNWMEVFDDPDLPDGAWQAMLQDSVEHYNEANGTDYDPFECFLAYCEQK